MCTSNVTFLWSSWRIFFFSLSTKHKKHVLEMKVPIDNLVWLWKSADVIRILPFSCRISNYEHTFCAFDDYICLQAWTTCCCFFFMIDNEIESCSCTSCIQQFYIHNVLLSVVENANNGQRSTMNISAKICLFSLCSNLFTIVYEIDL